MIQIIHVNVYVGAPMGCAPMAHTLFSRFLNVDPQDPDYIARDRFVLSNGHASALHYIMLHLMGFDMTVQDLKDFRRLGSKYELSLMLVFMHEK